MSVDVTKVLDVSDIVELKHPWMSIQVSGMNIKQCEAIEKLETGTDQFMGHSVPVSRAFQLFTLFCVKQ